LQFKIAQNFLVNNIPAPTISERYYQWSMLPAIWKTSWATKRSSKC